jgi:hypothetical protein
VSTTRDHGDADADPGEESRLFSSGQYADQDHQTGMQEMSIEPVPAFTVRSP